MVLGKLPVPGRPTDLDYSRARAYCACSGWGLFGHFFSLVYHFFFLSPSLWETARYRLKYCLKGPLMPKQPTNQTWMSLWMSFFVLSFFPRMSCIWLVVGCFGFKGPLRLYFSLYRPVSQDREKEKRKDR